ncbi:MAG: hypothetical protein IPM54_02000 [Polyangiaceae bacterium]|nr:hypothetical protein [Polyangiaceae bacterium]
MKLSYLALFAALFLDHGVTETMAAPASVSEDAPAAPVDLLAPAPAAELPAEKPELPIAMPELPRDMRVVVTSKAGRTMLTLVRPGHLVTLMQGDQRVFGDNSASLSPAGTLPIAWETSERTTFETLRGEVEWDGQSARLRATALLSPVGETSSARHDCKAFDGGNGAVTVVCRIDSWAAGAARVFGDKPQAGINTIDAEDKKFFRAELDAGSDGVDAVVLGYSQGSVGHVIRAEASVLPGETKPSFSLLATSRAQPFVFPRFRRHPPPHIHKIPREVDILF